jgi:hypothetical protein
VYAIVGGIRTPLGPIVGTGAVTLAVQIFQRYQSFELIFTGASLILVTFVLPGGIESLWLYWIGPRHRRNGGRFQSHPALNLRALVAGERSGGKISDGHRSAEDAGA